MRTPRYLGLVSDGIWIFVDVDPWVVPIDLMCWVCVCGSNAFLWVWGSVRVQSGFAQYTAWLDGSCIAQMRILFRWPRSQGHPHTSGILFEVLRDVLCCTHLT